MYTHTNLHTPFSHQLTHSHLLTPTVSHQLTQLDALTGTHIILFNSHYLSLHSHFHSSSIVSLLYASACATYKRKNFTHVLASCTSQTLPTISSRLDRLASKVNKQGRVQDFSVSIFGFCL